MSTARSNMKLLSLVVVLGACGVGEPPEEVSVTESASTDGQGTDYQGTDYQGTDYQGTDYQGTDYQGTDYQGTDYQGGAYGSVTINATGIETWTQLVDTTWEQRTPTTVCHWDALKSNLLAPCTAYNLDVSPSPLAGSSWQATFTKMVGGVPTPFTGTIRIGHNTTQVGAIAKDTSQAMYALDGTPAASCATPTNINCSNPNKCRQNCDLFTYELWLVTDDGVELPFCKGGVRAYALPGTWDGTGAHSGTSGRFTFACWNGTIAKCTRWGYRPWSDAVAKKSDGTYANTADYHQACVRAATADYCSNGTSFTKNGTLVDVYDYGTAPESYLPSAGFIPRAATSSDTTFLWESTFDPIGAATFDHLRYEEKIAQLENPTYGCPNRFVAITHPFANFYRSSQYGAMGSPRVAVSNSTSCQHSEQTVGRTLDTRCNWNCIAAVDAIVPYCNDPGDPHGWDAACASAATTACKNNTSTAPMAYHSECTTGIGLMKYDSACTFAVCSQSPGCCQGSFFPNWSTSCVNTANSMCKGGRETLTKGFCGTSLIVGNG